MMVMYSGTKRTSFVLSTLSKDDNKTCSKIGYLLVSYLCSLIRAHGYNQKYIISN
jgi:hypothetical protein